MLPHDLITPDRAKALQCVDSVVRHGVDTTPPSLCPTPPMTTRFRRRAAEEFQDRESMLAVRGCCGCAHANAKR